MWEARGRTDPLRTDEAAMRLVLVILLVIVMTTTHAQSAGCAGDSDVACTEQGAVRGVVEGETLAFKGIPYARPPVGPLRWRPPEPPEPWQGVRDGGRYGSF